MNTIQRHRKEIDAILHEIRATTISLARGGMTGLDHEDREEALEIVKRALEAAYRAGMERAC